ncbi:MAG: hypothetical protein K2Q21_14470 [Chitinophagaceae bacterium]|nr:hypothetical protein [Chitinophagaceae bacterium]
MTKLKEKVNALNQLIISGNTIKAMETFYSYDIEMQENEDTPRKGKNVCIEAERDNLQKVKKVESILLDQAFNEDKNVVFSEWKFLVTYKDNNKFMLTEVSVQHWLDGQIVKEKFYYKNFCKTD